MFCEKKFIVKENPSKKKKKQAKKKNLEGQKSNWIEHRTLRCEKEKSVEWTNERRHPRHGKMFVNYSNVENF